MEKTRPVEEQRDEQTKHVHSKYFRRDVYKVLLSLVVIHWLYLAFALRNLPHSYFSSFHKPEVQGDSFPFNCYSPCQAHASLHVHLLIQGLQSLVTNTKIVGFPIHSLLTITFYVIVVCTSNTMYIYVVVVGSARE